jgi:tyrosyl-tRNA synthetase
LVIKTPFLRRSYQTKEEVLENLKTFKDQIGKVINFDDKENPVEFRFNSEWLSKLNFEEVVGLASNFTVQQMLERDIFERRINENKPLYVHEFFYPLMQGYDSVALEADLEVGGTDQTFNMLAGRTLVKNYQNKEKFVLTTTLLENPVTKEKLMSKSLGTGIGLNEIPEEMFGKVMAMPDETIIQLFIDCTDLSLDKIAEYRANLENGDNPRDIKIALAKTIVTIYHGEQEALMAAHNFDQVFSKMGFPENAEIVNCLPSDKLIDILVNYGVVESKSEFKRLVTAGAISDYPDKKLIDPNEDVGNEVRKIKIGKKSFLILKPM